MVVGSGCAGLAACYTLCKYSAENSKVILIEKEHRVGGHARTVRIKQLGEEEEDDLMIINSEEEECDMGFMVSTTLPLPNLKSTTLLMVLCTLISQQVCNLNTYPNMLRIYKEIGQEIEKSDMSFCIHDGTISPSIHSIYHKAHLHSFMISFFVS